jgi:hypothetical protein
MHLSNVMHCFVNSTKEATMSKKEKTVFALVEDFQAMITMVPKLEAFIKVHKEIAAGYQKYRKNGGAAIPGIEKHLGIKEQNSAPSAKKKETATTTKAKAPEEGIPAIKTKKKVKK